MQCTGEVLWTYECQKPLFATPCCYGNSAYVACVDGSLNQVDALSDTKVRLLILSFSPMHFIFHILSMDIFVWNKIILSDMLHPNQCCFFPYDVFHFRGGVTPPSNPSSPLLWRILWIPRTVLSLDVTIIACIASQLVVPPCGHSKHHQPFMLHHL